jgi:mannosyltransferase
MIHRAEIAGRLTKYNVALLAISVLGLFLRIYHHGTESLWGDEAYSFLVSNNANVFGIIKVAALYDSHPPLYYIILHYGGIQLFGTSEFAVRFPSLVFGVLAIPMIYLLGRRLFNEEVGLISALILAISPFNVEYSQEARMYSLLLFLALLSMYFFVRFLERDSRAVSVGYVLSTTLLLYTHLFGLFVLIAQNIVVAGLLLLSRERRSRLTQWVLIQAITVILFAPWISVLSRQVNSAVQSNFASISSADPITLLIYLAAGQRGSYYPSVALLILFLGLAAFSLFTYRRAAQNALKGFLWEDRKNLATVCLLFVWLFTVFGLPLLLLALVSKTIIFVRYVIVASAPLFLLAAKGIRNINHSYAKLGVIAVIVILSGANLQTFYATARNPTAANAVNFVNENAQSGDLVIVLPYHPNDIVFQYYSFRPDLTVKYFPANFTD